MEPFLAYNNWALIDFYAHAFNGVTSPNQTNVNLDSGNQIWWAKEAFNFVALIGFFLMIVPLITLLIRLPFLRKTVTGEIATVSAAVEWETKINLLACYRIQHPDSSGLIPNLDG